jgi:hypothetical protein
MQVIFGEYKPDQPPHLQDGLLTAEGVYPIANGYAPLGQFVAASNGTLAAACLGATAYRAAGTVYIFAATATNIYTYALAGYTSIKSGLGTTAAIGMRFTAYNNLLLMTNGVDVIQKFDPASATVTTNLGGTPGLARFIATAAGFVVLGYAGAAATAPMTIKWSAFGDPANWSTLDAGSYIMATGGDITGAVGGEEYCLIFQEGRIIRMVPTGDNAVWDYQEVSQDIGCVAPWSLATYGKFTFFLSAKGFMVTDGVTVQPIGDEKIDRTFLALVDRAYIGNMSAAVDPTRSLYMVMAPSANPTNKLFLCQYGLGYKWTRATQAVERLFSSFGQGTDLDSLDAIYGNLDAIPLSLDSDLFRGGVPSLMLFDGSHRLGALTGSNMAATLQGPLQEVFPGLRARIRAVRPYCNASVLTVTLGGADSLSGGITATAYTDRTNGGFYRMRQSYNLSQVTLSIAAGQAWTYVQGYDIDAVRGGRA